MIYMALVLAAALVFFDVRALLMENKKGQAVLYIVLAALSAGLAILFLFTPLRLTNLIQSLPPI